MFEDEETSNFDLEVLAKKYDLPLVGIYSKDELPERVKIGSYIVNLQDSTDGQGSHWCLIKIFDKKNALWFDSFGQALPLEVLSFLKHYKPVPYSNRHIQTSIPLAAVFIVSRVIDICQQLKEEVCWSSSMIF